MAGAVPTPLKLTAWGLPGALSEMATDAARLPLAAGVKVTLMAQLDPAATETPQLFVCAKSVGLAPATAKLEIVSAAFPVFLSVTTCTLLVVVTAWFAKVTLVGVSVTAPLAALPVPARVMV